MQIGEEKKEGNQYQDLFSPWQVAQSPTLRRNKGSVALSSNESEYMAILHTLKEQIWLLRFLKEIGYDISDQNIIYCDNQSAIALTHNPEHHARTKHIDIQYHFVRNCVEDGRLRLEYCPTEDMVADGLTKALGPERHKRLTAKMGMDVWNDKRSDRQIATMRSGSVGGVSPVALGENGESKPVRENGGTSLPRMEKIIPSGTTGKGSLMEKANLTVML